VVLQAAVLMVVVRAAAAVAEAWGEGPVDPAEGSGAWDRQRIDATT